MVEQDDCFDFDGGNWSSTSHPIQTLENGDGEAGPVPGPLAENYINVIAPVLSIISQP